MTSFVGFLSPGYVIRRKKLSEGVLGLWAAAVRQAARDLQAALKDDEGDFWTRAMGVDAAFFLLRLAETFPLPFGVVRDARALLDRVNGQQVEYLAAAAYAVPGWQKEWRLGCLRCGRPAASWYRVFAPPREEVWTWRYERPENHVPLCHRCRWRLEKRFGSFPSVLRDLALALWGPRFRAWERVHRRALEEPDFRPDWDVERFPLWPYGGRGWAHGSGAVEHAVLRPPRGIARGAEERRLAGRYRARGLPDAPLSRIAAGREPYPVRKRRRVSERRNGR